MRTLKITLFMSPLFVFLAIKLLAPFIPLLNIADMHLSLTDWSLAVSGFVARERQSVLLLKMNNDPPGWGIAWERVLTIDPDDGAVLGQAVESTASRIIGVTPGALWLYTGSVKLKRLVQFSLPALDRLYDLDDLEHIAPEVADIIDDVWADGLDGNLLIRALNGYYYRWLPRQQKLQKLSPDKPPRTPTLMASWKSCRLDYRGRLLDFRGCRPLELDGDRFTLRSVASGGTHYFVIGRRRGEQIVWSVSDRQLFGALDEDDPLRYLRFVTLYKDKLLLVAEDGSGVDDIYAAAIAVKDGSTVWSRTFW